MSTIIKALDMIHILSSNNVVKVEALSQALELSIRSIQRLKSQLIDAGFDIQTIMGPDGGYRLESHAQIFPLAFEQEEIKLLKQAMSYVLSNDNQTFGEDLSKVLGKLSHQLDDQGMTSIPSFHSIQLNVDPKQYHEHIRLLEKAIKENLKVKVDYQKNHQEQRNYIFDSYEMVIVNKFWYLMGYDDKRRYLSLKVNRLNSVELLSTTFLKDENTNKKQSLGKFGYKIKPQVLKCLIENADYVSEYIWGENQTIDWIAPHKFILEVEFQNEKAVQDFILQQGSKLKILEPTEMIDWLKSELQMNLSKYLA